MIKIIIDGTPDTTIIVDNVNELASRLGEIFRSDPNPDVMLTYVVNRQPTSRRMAPTV